MARREASIDDVAIDVATPYAAENADLTLRVQRALSPSVSANPLLDGVYRTIELPTSAVLQKIERNGVLIDADLLNRQGAELGVRMADLEATAREEVERRRLLGQHDGVVEVAGEHPAADAQVGRRRRGDGRRRPPT